MLEKQKWVLPGNTRKMSEVFVSPTSSSGKRRSSNFKQYTQVVEKTSNFKVDQDKFHEDPLPSPSLKSYFDFELLPQNQPDPHSHLWSSEAAKSKKRRSIRELSSDINFRNTFSHKMPTENFEEVDRPKTSENITQILNVLKNHFIFFFSKMPSCKR